jgi:hypothetical protein
MKVDPLERASMMTAAEYRAMAEECLKWAREAQTREVRASYSQLAQVWLGAASKLDGLPATQAAPGLTNAKGLGEDGDCALETRLREDSKLAYGGAMDKTVSRLNIEHYRKSLATEQDETKRRTLMRLLAEEQAKLAALNNPPEKNGAALSAGLFDAPKERKA